MSGKEEQELEGANTISSNVDKDGDQIIHEEKANREKTKGGGRRIVLYTSHDITHYRT